MATIESYSFGRIKIDGEEHMKDVIVLPDRIVANWWRRDGHSLVLEDLKDVIDELPGRLIVGRGAQGRMQPDPDALRQLGEKGITVEVLDTGDAVRRYLELDPADAAAALHLTC